MPPKRAKTITARAPAMTSTRAPQTATRATRNTRARGKTVEIVCDEDVTGSLVRSGSRRQGKRAVQEEDVLVAGGLGAKSDTVSAEEEERNNEARDEDGQKTQAERPQAMQKKNVRQRPARALKKTTETEAQRLAIACLKARMEEDRRAKEALAAPVQDRRQSPRDSENAPATTMDKKTTRRATKSPSHTHSMMPETTARAAPGTVTKPPQSSLKVQSTPGAESTVIPLAQFKRRARQPSLLQMVQQGAFDHDQDSTDFTLASVEDDFAPDDESTPVQVRKAIEEALEIGVADEDEELYGVSPPPPNPRKRKSDEMADCSEVQVIRSSPSRPESLLSELDDGLAGNPATALPVPGTASDEAADNSSETPRRQVDSDTYAEPMSSSPPPMLPRSPIESGGPVRGRPPRLRTTIANSPQQSRRQDHRPVTTAALRALLPRRRITIERSELSIPSSSDIDQASSDHDELGPSRSRKAPPKGTKKSAKRPTKTDQRTTKTPTAPSPVAKRATNNTKKATTIATGKAKDPEKRRRTYGRSGTSPSGTSASASDKENAVASTSPLTSLSPSSPPGDGDTIVHIVSKATAAVKIPSDRGRQQQHGGELAKAREKFKVIDEWEMEFESAPSLGGAGGNSSPWR